MSNNFRQVRPSLAVLIVSSLVPAAFASGCLGTDDEPSRVKGRQLTLYSSLPFHGSSAQAARAVAAGQRLALADAGGAVGRYRLRLVQLDSSRTDGAGWDPAQVSSNAERAADDDTAIAYLGELDYGGSAVSLPVTNEAGLLQVSPGDGLTSLTRRVPGRPREGPERYYPSERRTFLRLVPDDLRLARALLTLIENEGARRIAIVHDESIYGRELSAELGRGARSRGLIPVGPIEDRDEPEDARAIADDLADERPDVVVYSGTPGASFAGLLAALRRELPGAPIWGGAGLSAAGAPTLAPQRVALLQPVRPPAAYPPEGRRLLRRLADQGPAALYGYEATRLVLDAIERAGPDRAAVARDALDAGERESPIGRYEVLPHGGVSEERFALYRLTGGRFAFERLVR